MNRKVVTILVIVVVIVLVAGLAVYLVAAKLSAVDTATTSGLQISTASESTSFIGTVAQVQIFSDNLTVGYQSGLWVFFVKNTGNVNVSEMVVYLETPIQSKVCSASSPGAGLNFAQCPSMAPGNPLPPGVTTFSSASGAGEGSGVPGMAYPVDAKVTYANGQTIWTNTTVIAKQPAS
jgi:hypothetical protein